jgi:hypothetical protein
VNIAAKFKCVISTLRRLTQCPCARPASGLILLLRLPDESDLGFRSTDAVEKLLIMISTFLHDH